MKTVSKNQILAIKPGTTAMFSLEDSSCIARAKQAVQYVKVNLLMPEGISDYHTSFDRSNNMFSIKAVAVGQ